MELIFVQFSDESETTIASYFGCPQDPSAWPNQGTIDTTDARWETFFNGQPPVAQMQLPKPPKAVA